MKVMSEGLQKVAGDRLRNILGAMTRNRITGVLTGITITALIQSSSASTVMVVSFVNAGLMSLEQSMAVIFGANVGTTATTWIISAFSGCGTLRYHGHDNAYREKYKHRADSEVGIVGEKREHLRILLKIRNIFAYQVKTHEKETEPYQKLTEALVAALLFTGMDFFRSRMRDNSRRQHRNHHHTCACVA